MNTTHCRRAAIWTLGLWLSAGTAFAQPTTIHPTSGPEGPYVIAVVSDGYTQSEAWKFDRAVNGLILNGLMADRFYRDHGSWITIKKLFTPVTQSGASAYGFTLDYDSTDCFVRDDANNDMTMTAIEHAGNNITPAPNRTIVIGNQEGVSFGCAKGTWTYITAGAREAGGVIEHELGHLIASLLDEYELPDHGTYDGSGSWPNCAVPQWTTNAKPWEPFWMAPLRQQQAIQPQLAMPTNPPGCNYFSSGIVRAYADPICRMRGQGAAFCAVCQHFLEEALKPESGSTMTMRTQPDALRIVQAAFVQPPPARETTQAPAPLIPAVRMIVELPSTPGGTPRVVTIADVSAPRARNYRRTGDLVYAVIDEASGTPIDTAVLPGDPFQERAYGSGGAPHRAQPATTANVVVLIRDKRQADLLTQSIGLRFYRLPPAQAGWYAGEVRPQNFDTLTRGTRPLAEVSSATLREAVRRPPRPAAAAAK